jgi:hypothetical protein
MRKKILFVTVLLLLVSVQALSASCDIRCTLMGASTGGHTLQTAMQMPHCQGMSMERDQGASLTANNSCAATTCGTELKALVKSADQSDAYAGKLLVSAVALLADPIGSTLSSRTIGFRSFSRTLDSKPLAQRPGSSLRI